jgi:hypothetical protein
MLTPPTRVDIQCLDIVKTSPNLTVCSKVLYKFDGLIRSWPKILTIVPTATFNA